MCDKHIILTPVLKTAPSLEPVTLTEVKTQCRIDGSAEDALLTSLIKTARLRVEDYLARALITQTWTMYAGCWPEGDRLKLTKGTLQSVTSVTYYGTDDAAYSMAADDDYAADTAAVPGVVVLRYGHSWPATLLRPNNPIAVEAIVGYGDEASDVPECVRQAILVLCDDMFEQRGDVITGTIVNRIGWLDALLAPERVWR